MSASDKKKLRKELTAAAMTEKQKKEQQEAKKLKAYTLLFAVVMILVVAVVVGVVAAPFVEGIVLRNSHTVTIGDYELSATDLSYFYIDAISDHQSTVYQQYYQTFGDYWTMMLGYDSTKALNEQAYGTEGGTTWADYFLNNAIDNAKSVYALYIDAQANGYQLPAETQTSLDSYFDNLSLYATYYGYSNVQSYLRNSYGNGANEKTYKNYYTICQIASSYLDEYADTLEYDAEDYRAYEQEKFDDYSQFSYVHYTTKIDTYLGTAKKDENNKDIPWTDAEKEAARQKLEDDVAKIMAEEIKDKESFDKAIQSLAINQTDADGKPLEDSKKPTATQADDKFIADIYLHADALDWIKVTDRKAGDIEKFAIRTYADHEDPAHEHSDDCGCSSTIDGYTIVLFVERQDNKMPLANVRHILVKFQGGTKDSNGNTTYTDAEKATAKAEAEALLKKWQDNQANEEYFGELANAESDDQGGKVTNGGLYEDILPGQMVKNFNDWCFDESRKAGDTGIVETEYGYHVMYYSSADEMTYRDYMIDSDMRTEATETWKNDLTKNVPYTLVSLDKMEMDLILG